MAHSDSDGDEMEDLEFENGTSEADGDEEAEVDDEILDALDNDPDDATEADEVSHQAHSSQVEKGCILNATRNRPRKNLKKARTTRTMRSLNTLQTKQQWR